MLMRISTEQNPDIFASINTHSLTLTHTLTHTHTHTHTHTQTHTHTHTHTHRNLLRRRSGIRERVTGLQQRLLASCQLLASCSANFHSLTHFHSLQTAKTEEGGLRHRSRNKCASLHVLSISTSAMSIFPELLQAGGYRLVGLRAALLASASLALVRADARPHSLHLLLFLLR